MSDGTIRAQLNAALMRLTPVERRVLELRHGYDGRAPMTLAAIAATIGVTVGEVREIERSALDRLRRYEQSLLSGS